MTAGEGGTAAAVHEEQRPAPQAWALSCWFTIGCLLAVVVLTAAAQAMGSWPALLRAGSANPLFVQLDRELGPLPSIDPIGHDGQLYYLIARDPLAASDVPAVIAAFDSNGPRYRYRRILFPLLSGGFGQFGPRATFLGMIVVLVVASGLGAMALADLARQLHLRTQMVAIALLNPGGLVGLVMLTGDVLALALALGAIALVLRQRFGWAIAACALAALSKETFLLVPAGVACWLGYRGRWRVALMSAILPAIPVLIWSVWLTVTLPPDAAVTRNLGIPLVGLLKAVPLWFLREPRFGEIALGGVACYMLVRAAQGMFRNSAHVLSWVAAPWIVLGCLATVHVWGRPNNAARALALLWPLGLALVSVRSRAGGPSTGVAGLRQGGAPSGDAADD